MSSNGNDRRSRLMGFDLKGVLEASRRQVRKDLEQIKGMSPVEGLRALREGIDLGRLQLGARGEGDLNGVLLGGLPSICFPSETECLAAAERLSARWAREWRLFAPRVRKALDVIAARDDVSPHEMKRRVLQVAVFEALYEAHEPQVTRIGDDKVMRLGSRLVRFQEKDLKQLAREGPTGELLGRMQRRPVGVAIFPPFRLVNPIEAALQGYDPRATRPADLSPSFLTWWVRTRTIKRAQERLLREAGFEIDKPRQDWTRVEVIQATDDLEVACPGVRELDVLEVLDRADPEPLLWLFARERLAEVLEVATPAQAETARLLWLYHVEQGWPVAEAIKQIARDRGVSDNTVHQTLVRLRARVEDRLSGFADLRR